MDDLEVPTFQETPIYISRKFVVNNKRCLMIFGLERNLQIGLTGNGN